MRPIAGNCGYCGWMFDHVWHDERRSVDWRQGVIFGIRIDRLGIVAMRIVELICNTSRCRSEWVCNVMINVQQAHPPLTLHIVGVRVA